MMQEPFYFQTIEGQNSAEFKDRGSKFLAFVYPVSDVAATKKYLTEIKAAHPKANHHCFAYRIGFDKNNFRVSDDGEPSGSAGKPILGQIDSKEVTNVLIVVVRYFGGTLLGVPGLINAYRSAASMALQVTPIVRKPILMPVSIQFDYTHMNDIMQVVKQFDCSITQQDLSLFCTMDISVPKIRYTEALQKLQDIRGIAVKG